MLGVLIFDTLPGLFIGIAVSILLLVYRASHPHVATLGKVAGSDQFTDVDRHPENATVAGVVIVRVDGCVVLRQRRQRRGRDPCPRQGTGGAGRHPRRRGDPVRRHQRRERAQERLSVAQDPGVRLVVAHDIGQVRDLFRVGGADHLLDNVYPTVQAAVEAVT